MTATSPQSRLAAPEILHDLREASPPTIVVPPAFTDVPGGRPSRPPENINTREFLCKRLTCISARRSRARVKVPARPAARS